MWQWVSPPEVFPRLVILLFRDIGLPHDVSFWHVIWCDIMKARLLGRGQPTFGRARVDGHG